MTSPPTEDSKLSSSKSDRSPIAERRSLSIRSRASIARDAGASCCSIESLRSAGRSARNTVRSRCCSTHRMNSPSFPTATVIKRSAIASRKARRASDKGNEYYEADRENRNGEKGADQSCHKALIGADGAWQLVKNRHSSILDRRCDAACFFRSRVWI